MDLEDKAMLKTLDAGAMDKMVISRIGSDPCGAIVKQSGKVNVGLKNLGATCYMNRSVFSLEFHS